MADAIETIQTITNKQSPRIALWWALLTRNIKLNKNDDWLLTPANLSHHGAKLHLPGFGRFIDSAPERPPTSLITVSACFRPSVSLSRLVLICSATPTLPEVSSPQCLTCKEQSESNKTDKYEDYDQKICVETLEAARPTWNLILYILIWIMEMGTLKGAEVAQSYVPNPPQILYKCK